jgi:TldD protein
MLNHYSVDDIPRRKFLEMGLKGSIALAATPTLMSHLVARASPDTLPTATLNLDRELFNKTLRKALEKGGEFGEVYVENRISRNILMEESKFKSAVYSISQGAGVRIIFGDKTGYAYTDELAEEDLLRAAEVASYIARGSAVSKPADIQEAQRRSFITIKIPLARSPMKSVWMS